MSKVAQMYARNPTKSEQKVLDLDEAGDRKEKEADKNNGSGQLIYLPESRAFAVDTATFSLSGLAAAKVFCGRPFLRWILSSLHREPDHRKRNAHCPTIRQSLHCLITGRYR
jgi:hypothetical protein